MGLFDSLIGPDINRGIDEWKKTPGSILLDVRTTDEYRQDHIPGSLNVELNDLQRISNWIPEKNTALFVHCLSGARSNQAALYVDTMYGEYVDGAVKITKAAASGQTSNGDGTEPSGTDLSSWISYDSTSGIGMTLAGAAAYRTSGAAKAMPGFDVMDYGQEDYVFGSSTADARHWDTYVLKVFEEHADALAELFN